MGLSNDLISQFAKLTNNEKKENPEVTCYGTVKQQGSAHYVQLDGSETLTPVTSTTAIKDGDRVTVLIKDHTATVTGNISDPSASGAAVAEANTKIDEFGIIIAEKVSTKELYAEKARIDELVAKNVTIEDTLNANKIIAESIQADNVVINETLTAAQAKITKLEADFAEIDAISAKDLEVVNATIENLHADYAEFKSVTTDDITAIDGKFFELNSDYGNFKDLTTEKLTANEANITKLNSDFIEVKELVAETATLNKLIATDAEIEELQAGNITVVGKVTAAEAEIQDIVASTIKTNSLEAYKVTTDELFATNADIDKLKTDYLNALKIESDTAKIQQLTAAIAKIETLQATMANVEKLISQTVITDNLEASQATIDNLTSSLANIDQAIIDIAEIEDLEAVNAAIENLNTQYIHAVQADVDNLNAKSATIEHLRAYALQSDFAKIESLVVDDIQANVANINSVLAGNVGTELLQAIHLTAENVVIDDAVIKSANIESIDTDIVTIGNDNIILSGSTQQFKDKDGNVRVQIGQDAQGEFNFIVANQNGATIITPEGITENAVPDGLIVDEMVSENANIQANKIQYLDRNGNTTLQTHLEVEQGKMDTLIKETSFFDFYGAIVDENGVLTFDILPNVEEGVLDFPEDPGIDIEGTLGSTRIKDAYLHTVQTVNGIKTTIGDVEYFGDSISSKISTVEQTADKINWVVKSGTGTTDFELTDRAATLVSDYINLHGLVTFFSEEPGEDSTSINGGYIQTNTIKADKLDVVEIFSNKAVIDEIATYELNADRITSGIIKSDFIELYGLSVSNPDTGIETFKIETDGEVNIRGNIESYNYQSGKTGWAIHSNGDSEFNDITVRGSVIGNFGGIVSCGGSCTNLQQDSLFSNDVISNKWKYNVAYYSVDNSVQYDNSNSVKYERTGYDDLEDHAADFYTNVDNNPITPTAGESYTISAKFFTRDTAGLLGRQPIFGIWYYQANDEGTMVPIQTEYKVIPFSSNEWIDFSMTSVCPEGAQKMALVIRAYNNGTFWVSRPKIEVGDVATSWSLAIEDDVKQVVHWAGSTYSEREQAPAIIYSDGSVKFSKGEFGGVFTGDIQIGNISIVDTSSSSGNDATLTIQDGADGVKRVQLTDTTSSSFAQDIRITNNTYSDAIVLHQNGVGLFKGDVKVTNGTYSTVVSNSSININGSSIIANVNTMRVSSGTFSVGKSDDICNLSVYGETTLNDNLTVKGEILIGSHIKITNGANGIDIDYI